MDVMELLTSTLIQGLIYALISYGSISPIPFWTSRTWGWTAPFPWGRCHGGADDPRRQRLADLPSPWWSGAWRASSPAWST